MKQKIDGIKNPILADEKALGNPLDTSEEAARRALVDGWNQESQRRQQEAQRAAEEAARKASRRRRSTTCHRLAAAGEDEASDAVLEETIVAAPVVVHAPVSKPTGSVGRKYYKCKVTSLKALVAAVAAGTVSILALTANQSLLNDQADSCKEAFSYPRLCVGHDDEHFVPVVAMAESNLQMRIQAARGYYDGKGQPPLLEQLCMIHGITQGSSRPSSESRSSMPRI